MANLMRDVTLANILAPITHEAVRLDLRSTLGIIISPSLGFAGFDSGKSEEAAIRRTPRHVLTTWIQRLKDQLASVSSTTSSRIADAEMKHLAAKVEISRLRRLATDMEDAADRARAIEVKQAEDENLTPVAKIAAQCSIRAEIAVMEKIFEQRAIICKRRKQQKERKVKKQALARKEAGDDD
jgi:hypothetical protein